MKNTVKYYYSKPLVFNTIVKHPTNGNDVKVASKQGRRYTIAIVYNYEERIISFGLAICQSIDNFNKKIGGNIALAKAISKPFKVIQNFNGRRNDYADEVIKICIDKETEMLKKTYPYLFNPKNLW